MKVPYYLSSCLKIMNSKQRRSFLKKGVGLATLPLLGLSPRTPLPKDSKKNLKLSLNAFSFNASLRDGTLSLERLFRYCAENSIPAIDLTAYYISNYPEVPEDKVLYGIKKQAHHWGLDISGSGVRNDFTLQNTDLRKKEIDLVKNGL